MPISPLSKPRPCAQGRGKPTVLITMGDPSGIGPEVILKSLASRKIQRLANFFVIGDYFILRRLEKRLGIKPYLKVVDLKHVPQKKFKFGKIDKLYGRASVEYLKEALSILRKDRKTALVTAPISKEAINKAGFRYSGHTEFLAKSTGVSKFAMMLVGGPLRVTLITRHIPIKDISDNINQKKIIEAIELTHKFLARYLNKRYPRIAIASLNPHAGEGGILGDEEKRVILPSVIKAKKRYKNVYGPVAPDAVFHDAYNGRVDAVVCMYHDQALIPLKMIARDKGVNITLGLPFIRTSPDHGTAFDIAGKGVANPSSMMEAIKMAVRLVKQDVK